MDVFAQAVELKNQRRYQEALPLIQQAVANFPTSQFVWVVLSEILLETNDPIQALHAADKAISIDSAYAPAWVMKGRGLAKIDRPEEGIAACQRAITYNNKLVMAYLEMGIIYNNLERHSEALDAYDQALMMDSTNSRILFKKCETLIALQRIQEAQTLSNRLLRIAPDNPDTWFASAHVLANLERFRQAEDAINRCIAIEGPKSNSLMLKSAIVWAQKRVGEARSLARKAAELDPSNQLARELHGDVTKARNAKMLNTGIKVGKVTTGILGAFAKEIFRT